ncbi:unnamed protein product [Thlaspi arvense]|uniref:SHSP domain-containing protein n=1 Tax=Thlaspi arvense TaxID=13288 RepID=A0AAU9RQU0_THLAR|nr:unnamed protein product [Thlaspi arvense]
MADYAYMDITRFTANPDGFYATNNPFQKSGPKGFIEVKVLENDKLYIRVDLPGVPDDAVRHRVDAVRQKVVFFSGKTLDDGRNKGSVREYSGSAGLSCDCCEITGVDAKMKDGVLRMIVSRVKVKDHDKKCPLTFPPFTGKSGRRQEDHPFLVKGPQGASFAGGVTPDGGTYFALDVPGASTADLQWVAIENGLRFIAQKKKVCEHDKSARLYLGSFGTLDSSTAISLNSITATVNFGVLKIVNGPLRNQ